LTAAVDGVPVSIEEADAIFRAVRIGSGRHHVAFRYETPWAFPGPAVTAASWAAWLAAVVMGWRRYRITRSRGLQPSP
jgi:hypothetical protein